MGNSTSPVDPASVNALTDRYFSSREKGKPNRVAAVGDFEIAGVLLGASHTTREGWPKKFEDLLYKAFGFEPKIFDNKHSFAVGEEGRLLGEEGRLIFVTGADSSPKSASVKKAFGDISVSVDSAKAIVEITTYSREDEAFVADLAKNLPEAQSLLSKFLTKSKRTQIKYSRSGDPIFADFMNKGGPHYLYRHSVKVPREFLTAFMIELDAVAHFNPYARR
jgi:hypothetical protein